MLKRIALTVVFVVTAASVGTSVARARSGADAKPVRIETTAKGFCPNGMHC
jgi:hypothetical protein